MSEAAITGHWTATSGLVRKSGYPETKTRSAPTPITIWLNVLASGLPTASNDRDEKDDSGQSVVANRQLTHGKAASAKSFRKRPAASKIASKRQ
jgi:hypothetical protein